MVSWLRRGPFSCAIDVAHDAISPSSALATKTSVGAVSTFATDCGLDFSKSPIPHCVYSSYIGSGAGCLRQHLVDISVFWVTSIGTLRPDDFGHWFFFLDF